jgi:hypothetical protein
MELFRVISFTAFSGVGILLNLTLILPRTCGTSLASPYTTSIPYSYSFIQRLSSEAGRG